MREDHKMKKTFFVLIIAASILISCAARAGEAAVSVSERWLHDRWTASWAAHPDGPQHDPAVFLFRRTFDLDKKPSRFVVLVSADQRYRLWVNGVSVSAGPARGDTLHWRFETVDIAPQLNAGKNLLSARVWSEGDMAPWAQFSAHTAFIMQGDGDAEQVANTPGGWKVYRDTSWTPVAGDNRRIAQFATGPNERIDAARHPWGWLEPDFDDSGWAAPVSVTDGVPVGLRGDGSSLWQLMLRPIPLLSEVPERIPKVVRAKKVKVPAEFLEGKAPITIPPKTTASILLDNTLLTNAYPELITSGGAGSKVHLSYEESLFKYPEVAVWNLIKGNRNQTKNFAMRENYKFDEFLPDGGAHRVFSPFWFRTFRYMQIDVTTAAEPLVIEDIRAVATGYPFVARGSFDSSDPTLKTIWETGFRTARLCAVETYFDCPFYEQLQYVGDTRVQAMLSYYVPGDDRLARNAIDQLLDSRVSEGLTMSRYPSRMTQIIPTFSLAWIGMIHDHWMMRGDKQFTKKFIPAMGEVIGWFESHRLSNGLIARQPWWNFVDWAWPGGAPPGSGDTGSSIITLQFVLALREAADSESALGVQDAAKRHRALADSLLKSAVKTCWDAKKGLFADAPDKKSYSQHATILAVLADAVPPKQIKSAMEKVISDKSLTQCSLYFRYFLNRAIDKAGLGDIYISLLGPWRDALDMGLTTWPETPGDTRSDCHAWSSSPSIDLESIVCGVKPASAGFAKVRVEPHLGTLDWARCSVPHPKGDIRVDLVKNGAGIKAEIELPAGTPGVFVWRGSEIPLHPGRQTIEKK